MNKQQLVEEVAKRANFGSETLNTRSATAAELDIVNVATVQLTSDNSDTLYGVMIDSCRRLNCCFHSNFGKESQF